MKPENDAASPSTDSRLEPSGRGGRAMEAWLLFFAASGIAFTNLVFFDAWRAGGFDASAVLAAPYAMLLASVVACGLTAFLGVLHIVERVPRVEWAVVASSTVLVVSTVPLALPIATELAEGDGAALLLRSEWGTVVAMTGLEFGLLALFLWHRIVGGVARDVRPVRLRVLGAFGIVASAGGLVVLGAGLRAYAFLVDLVAIVVVTLVATLLFALAARPRPVRRAVIGTWFVVSGVMTVRVVTSPRALAEGREALLPASQVAARFDRLLWEPTGAVTLRIDPTAPPRCDEGSTPRALGPFAMPAERPRNVVLVSIDALRGDAVRWECRQRPVMPNLAAFLDGSVHTTKAVSTYPATIFAIESALSGLHPSRVLFAPSRPRSMFSLVAERVEVRSAHMPTSHWFGKPAVRALFLDGLRVSRHENAEAQVRDVVDELERARAEGKTYAVWAHFFEPHHPYVAHAGFDLGATANARYASELAYLDAHLGTLFDFLVRSGAYEDTLVVLFADHGEALGERGYHGHHVYLDGYLTDVPLAVRAPGLGPRAIEGVVEITDVAATVAHFFGVPQNEGSAGSSLLLGDPPHDRIAISEAFPIRGSDLFDVANRPVRSLDELELRMRRIHDGTRRYAPKVALATNDFRLIVDRRTGMRELYRRGSTPGEQPNVARLEPRRLASLTARLERWHRRTAEAIHCAVRGAATTGAPPTPSPPR